MLTSFSSSPEEEEKVTDVMGSLLIIAPPFLKIQPPLALCELVNLSVADCD
jgi:hypothetical protein